MSQEKQLPQPSEPCIVSWRSKPISNCDEVLARLQQQGSMRTQQGTVRTQPSASQLSRQTSKPAFSQPAFSQQTSKAAFSQQMSKPAFSQQTSKAAFSQQMSKPAFSQQTSKAAFSQQTSKVASSQQLSKVASTQQLSKVASAPSASVSRVTASRSKTVVGDIEEEVRQWVSPCGAMGHDPTKCQSRIKMLICKREQKNVELEKREGDLFQRLQMLECSMPAVMVWQAWRAKGSASSPEALRDAVDKSFAEAAEGYACRVTPSRHYDCRVREMEAQRKVACRRAEEAHRLWLEREAALQCQRARVDLARQQQEERRRRMDSLLEEVQKIQNECEGPASGEGAGRTKWLELVESAASLRSVDLVCLERLESLAAAESCMRKRIAELEAKEEAYMQTLARADEICRIENPDTADDSECSKLRVELEETRKQLDDCCVELNKYRREYNDKFSQASPICRNRETQGSPNRSQDRDAGRDGDLAGVRDQASEADRPFVENKESMASVDVVHKDVGAAVECVPACVGNYRSQANKGVHTRATTRDKTSQSRPDLADKSFTCEYQCGYGNDGPGEVCPPDFCCNDVVDDPRGICESGTGTGSGIGADGRRLDAQVSRTGQPESEKLPSSLICKKDSKASSAAGSHVLSCREEGKGPSQTWTLSKSGGSSACSAPAPREEVDECLSLVNHLRDKIMGTSKYDLVENDIDKLQNKLGAIKPSKAKAKKVPSTGEMSRGRSQVSSKSKESIITKGSGTSKSVRSILKSTPSTQLSKSQKSLTKSESKRSMQSKTKTPTLRSVPSVASKKSCVTVTASKKSCVTKSESRKSVKVGVPSIRSVPSAVSSRRKTPTPSKAGSKASLPICSLILSQKDQASGRSKDWTSTKSATTSVHIVASKGTGSKVSIRDTSVDRPTSAKSVEASLSQKGAGTLGKAESEVRSVDLSCTLQPQFSAILSKGTRSETTSTKAKSIKSVTTSIQPKVTMSATTSFMGKVTKSETTSIPAIVTKSQTTATTPKDTKSETTSIPPKSTKSETTSIPPKSTKSETTSIPPKSTKSETTSIPPKSTKSETTSIPPTKTKSQTTFTPPKSTKSQATSIPPKSTKSETTSAKLPSTKSAATTVQSKTSTKSVATAAQSKTSTKSAATTVQSKTSTKSAAMSTSKQVTKSETTSIPARSIKSEATSAVELQTSSTEVERDALKSLALTAMAKEMGTTTSALAVATLAAAESLPCCCILPDTESTMMEITEGALLGTGVIELVVEGIQVPSIECREQRATCPGKLDRKEEKIEEKKEKKPDMSEDVCICEPLTKLLAERQRQEAAMMEAAALSRLSRHRPRRRRRRLPLACCHPPETSCCCKCVGQGRNEGRRPKEAGRKELHAKEECREDWCSRRSECIRADTKTSLTKRDQGVLAKLPKAKRCRAQLEVLFDKSRKACILEAISSGSCKITNKRGRRGSRHSLGPSCTCVKNYCRCG